MNMSVYEDLRVYGAFGVDLQDSLKPSVRVLGSQGHRHQAGATRASSSYKNNMERAPHNA